MKKTRYIIVILGILLILLNTAFIKVKSGVEYGLLSVTPIDNEEYSRFIVVDLKTLDSLNIVYSCEMGGSFCQVNLKTEEGKAKKLGLCNEVLQIDARPTSAEYSGKGFHFSYEYDKK